MIAEDWIQCIRRQTKAKIRGRKEHCAVTKGMEEVFMY